MFLPKSLSERDPSPRVSGSSQDSRLAEGHPRRQPDFSPPKRSNRAIPSRTNCIRKQTTSISMAQPSDDDFAPALHLQLNEFGKEVWVVSDDDEPPARPPPTPRRRADRDGPPRHPAQPMHFPRHPSRMQTVVPPQALPPTSRRLIPRAPPLRGRTGVVFARRHQAEQMLHFTQHSSPMHTPAPPHPHPRATRGLHRPPPPPRHQTDLSRAFRDVIQTTQAAIQPWSAVQPARLRIRFRPPFDGSFRCRPRLNGWQIELMNTRSAWSSPPLDSLRREAPPIQLPRLPRRVRSRRSGA